MSELPEPPDDREVVAPVSRAEWRAWLAANHDQSERIWLAYAKKNAAVQGLSYEDAVEEALCFGWIDSVAAAGNDRWSLLTFGPRRKGSIWSKVNKERIERMIAAGLMTEAGMAVIEAAKADGSWDQYNDVDDLIIHEDLAEALKASPEAKAVFEALAPSRKRLHLWHVYSAKRPETRAKRIEETVRNLLAPPLS